MADGTASQAVHAGIVSTLPRLRRFCRAMAGNVVDGDDLMQSTVARALASAGQFEPGTRIDYWLFRIARNLHIDLVRRDRHRGPLASIDEIAETIGEDGRDLTENRSQITAAQKALQAVPENQRAAFTLVVIEGMTYREAADVLEVAVGTIMSRIARARVRIDAEINGGAEAQQ